MIRVKLTEIRKTHFDLCLCDGVAVQDPHRDVHVVPMGIQAAHVDCLGRHTHKHCHAPILSLKTNIFYVKNNL